jgi:hypothetical protein
MQNALRFLLPSGCSWIRGGCNLRCESALFMCACMSSETRQDTLAELKDRNALGRKLLASKEARLEELHSKLRGSETNRLVGQPLTRCLSIVFCVRGLHPWFPRPEVLCYDVASVYAHRAQLDSWKAQLLEAEVELKDARRLIKVCASVAVSLPGLRAAGFGLHLTAQTYRRCTGVAPTFVSVGVVQEGEVLPLSLADLDAEDARLAESERQVWVAAVFRVGLGGAMRPVWHPFPAAFLGCPLGAE